MIYDFKNDTLFFNRYLIEFNEMLAVRNLMLEKREF